MREYSFEIGERKFIVSEGDDLLLNSRAVTTWEVRELCQPEGGADYYHQRGNCYLPRSASKARIQAHVTQNYAA